MDASYSANYKGIKDKTLFMLKKQLNPIMIDLIKEENWDTDIINNPEAFSLMGSRVKRILDEVAELGKVRSERPFEYPVIISFLASYCLGSCAVPKDYLSQFEFERLQFASTGLTM